MSKQIVNFPGATDNRRFGRSQRLSPNTACYHSYISNSHEFWIREIDSREGKKIQNEEKKREVEEWEEARSRDVALSQYTRDILDGIESFNPFVWYDAGDLLYAKLISRQDYQKLEEMAHAYALKERMEEEAVRKREERDVFWERHFDNLPVRRTRRARKKERK